MIAFISGVFVGVVVGVFVLSLCAAARRGDEGMEREG